MVKLDLNVDYKMDEAWAKEFPTNAQLSRHFIAFAIRRKYPEGLEGQKRRIHGRFQDKLDDAAEGKSSVMDLETAEAEFLEKCFSDDVKFPVDWSKLVMKLEDAVDNMYDEPVATPKKK